MNQPDRYELPLDAFVRAAGDAIIAANSDGVIVLWNPAAERIFGYSADEALGNSLDLIIPKRFRQRHWDASRATMSTGATKYSSDVLRVPALQRGGRTISIAFTVALLPAADDGRVETIVAIVRDETERWEEERAMREQIAELQRSSDRLDQKPVK